LFIAIADLVLGGPNVLVICGLFVDQQTYIARQ